MQLVEQEMIFLNEDENLERGNFNEKKANSQMIIYWE